ncbi:MAG: gas vesicle protein [Chloroflexi bacterium]|nr:gas vesicle protein [Chloroflexota bacterium]
MEYRGAPQATLVDLLDRVLERGLVLDADIVICLAGVPLIGLRLRAALAGMETMTKYGLMQDWDREVRAGAQSLQKGAALLAGQAVQPGLH